MSRITRARRIFNEEMIVHKDTVYRYLYRLCGNSEADAKDLTQETFMRAYEKIDKYEEGTNARAWLFTIGHHLFINAIRKHNRRGEVEMDERIAFQQIDDSRAFSGYDDSFDPELLDLPVSDELAKALALLSPEQRTIVLMSDLHDFSEKEIAEHFNMNLNTVKGKIRRGRIAVIKRTETFAEEKFGIVTSRNLG